MRNGTVVKPCAYVDHNGELNGMAMVNCDLRCEHCAFNPEEVKRRLQRGKFVENEDGTKTLHFDSIDMQIQHVGYTLAQMGYDK